MTFAPIVAAALEAELAELSRVVDAPVPPLGFGVDLSCVEDVTEDFTETDPSSARGVAESVIRRFVTPRGGLLDDADYGFDLRGALNRGVTQAELRSLQTHAQNEARKDERVESADVRISADALAKSIRVEVTIQPRDPALDAFRFVLSVTSEAVLLELIGA